MIDMDRNENLDACKKCGGMCCIKCGCDYSALDFSDRSYKGLLETLSKGDKSIVAAINFRTLPNGKFIYEPFLYIRARNINRDIIDLVSMKTVCSQLGENGCKYDYEHRPFGGRNLIPSRYIDGTCKPMINPISILNSWSPYQKQLGKIVKQFTGMSVSEKISQDVENLFCDVLNRNYQDVSKLEIEDLKGFIPLLARAFPLEKKSARERCNISNIKTLSKKD